MISSNSTGRWAEKAKLGKLVDLFGQREVCVGDAALGVSRAGDPYLVPVVNEDVGVMVGHLGYSGDAVNELNCRLKVGQRVVADDSAVLVAPLALSDCCFDHVVL